MAKLVGEITEKEFDELQNEINENFERIRSVMGEGHFIFINDLFMGTCLKDCFKDHPVFSILKEGKDDDKSEDC